MSRHIMKSEEEMRIYTRLRTEIEPSIYRFWRKYYPASIIATILAAITGFSQSDPTRTSLYEYIVFVLFLSTLVALFVNLSYDNKIEDELSIQILKYINNNSISDFSLNLMEIKASESKSSSATRIQTSVILIPSIAAIIASLVALNISIPIFVMLVVGILFSVLTNVLNDEIKRLRFDDALLLSIKLYRNGL